MKGWSTVFQFTLFQLIFQSALFQSATIALLLSGFLSGLHLQRASANSIQMNSSQMASSQVASSRLLETGLTQYQTGDYSGAIVTWQKALQETSNEFQQAQILDNLARTYHQIGQAQPEIETWNQLIALHQRTQNKSAMARILTEKAQALSRQGQSPQAGVMLCDHVDVQRCGEKSAIGIARQIGDRSTEAASLGSLGEVYRLQGDYAKAIEVLQLALNLATELKIPTFQTAANQSLGNTYSNWAATRYRKSAVFAVQDPAESQKLIQQGNELDRKSLQYYQNSLAQIQPHPLRSDPARPVENLGVYFQALTHMIPIYQRLGDRAAVQRTWQQAEERLHQLPASRVSAYGAIDLARLSQMQLGLTNKGRCPNSPLATSAESLLKKAQSIALTIGDRRASSFALGALGDLAECAGRWDEALNYSQQAILAAQLSDRDSLYLWEWQRGRILKQQGDTSGAIAAYTRSIAILEQVRREMVQANRDVQFDFRDTIDPIYRELVDLQLSQESTIASASSLSTVTKPKQHSKLDPKSNRTSHSLQSTLATLDALKIAELQNYFGNDCVIAFVKDRIDQRMQPDAAVITTVIGEDRTAVIISLPNGERKFNWIPVKRSVLEKTIDTYRLGLESFDLAPQGYDKTQARQLYDWLIQPFETELAGLNTLVFVQDGLLRSVPMAALHDGRQFLIEKYAIATAPSLSLVDAKPIAIDRKNLNILALGLTQEATIGSSNFQALKQVKGELKGVSESFPRTTTLLDQDFTRKRIKTALQDSSYSILHIATHGKFGIEAEDTFFVTGDAEAENQRFNLNDLEKLIRTVSKNTEPLDLLVLTACETAIGDDRSALGLAGVAVQSGASSAIASLWAVNDNTTAELSTTLYAQLGNAKNNKAQALQAAQVKMIQNGGVTAHPYYWSAFVLVGNWL